MYDVISEELEEKLNKQLSEETRKELEVELKQVYRRSFIKNNKLRTYSILATIVLIFLFAIPIFIWFNFSLKDDPSIGELGDLFNGILGPIIGFFTLVAAIAAYISQQKQLDVQRIQVEKQRIENQFFQLINLHNEIVNSLFYYKDDLGKEFKSKFTGELKGRAYFIAVYFKFIKYSRDDNSPDKNKYYSIMRKLDNDEQDQLYHYYRNMYQLFNCIYKNRKTLSDEEQRDYIEVINAQLTYYEKQLQFFNTKFYGSDGFEKILLNYEFFKDYDTNQYSNIISKFENDAELLYPIFFQNQSD